MSKLIYRCSECEEECVLRTVIPDDYLDNQDPWFSGFDTGIVGGTPESPNGCYLEGFCDGVIVREEADCRQ